MYCNLSGVLILYTLHCILLGCPRCPCVALPLLALLGSPWHVLFCALGPVSSPSRHVSSYLGVTIFDRPLSYRAVSYF